VTFSDDLDTGIGLKFITGQECFIPQNVETTCPLELKPSKESYGTKTLPANARLTYVDDESQSAEVVISVEVWMETARKAARGVWIALFLIVVFLVIQGVQRFLFATLMSRFAALNPIDRRARLDIEISATGHVSGRGGSLFTVSNGDESFVFENAEPTATFYLFGYQFDTSALRTFLRSTSVPQGLVTQEGKYVFGSAGTHIDKKNSGTSHGIVNLSLRHQWIIGVNDDDMLRLADGVGQVNAELVVYLDAPEKTSFDQQLSDLNFEIAGGRLPQDISLVITRLRESGPDDVSGRGTQSEVDDIFGESNVITGLNDPFASVGNINSGNKSADDHSKRPRFGRKQKAKNEENDMVDEGGFSSPDLNDPFA
jgi:hypothetical protein